MHTSWLLVAVGGSSDRDKGRGMVTGTEIGGNSVTGKMGGGGHEVVSFEEGNSDEKVDEAAAVVATRGGAMTRWRKGGKNGEREK